MINFSFKLDPSLREIADRGHAAQVSVTVFVSPEIETKEAERLEQLGLHMPARRRDGWSGTLTIDELILIASMPGVGYIANAANEAGPNRRTPPRYRPPA